jgi:hypothetical protein
LLLRALSIFAARVIGGRKMRRLICEGRGRRLFDHFIAVALLLCAGGTARAQQTVFNVPTTDALDRGKVYTELDTSVKFYKSADVPEFSSFVPRVVVGVGHRVEVGLNVLGNIQPGPDATTLVTAVKWKFYDGKRNGWALALGTHLYVPVRHKSYDAGNYSYLMASKTIKARARIGAGGYFFSRNVAASHANRAGGQFTFEQPLTKRLNWNADWFTGKHAAGYFTTGTAYKLTDRLTGVASYSIGNQKASKGNHFFYFELGYNIN